MQAGDYDAAAVRAKLEGILTSKPVRWGKHSRGSKGSNTATRRARFRAAQARALRSSFPALRTPAPPHALRQHAPTPASCGLLLLHLPLSSCISCLPHTQVPPPNPQHTHRSSSSPSPRAPSAPPLSPLNPPSPPLPHQVVFSFCTCPSQAPTLKRAPPHPLQVVVFSFSTCPFCVRAKALLNELGAEYEVLELNQMGPEGMQLRAELAEARGAEGGGTGYACAWAAATGRGHAPPPRLYAPTPTHTHAAAAAPPPRPRR